MNTKFQTSTLVYRLAGDLNGGPTPLPPSNYEQSVQHLPKRPTSKFGKCYMLNAGAYPFERVIRNVNIHGIE